MWTSIFYNNYFIRPSCYECAYKTTLHQSEITIGDYWGIEKAAPGFDDNKGVSLVLINNDIGYELFQEAKKDINFVETRLEDSMQKPLYEPYPKPDGREKAWQDFSEMSFDKFSKVYCHNGLKQKIKMHVYRLKNLMEKH